MSLPSQHPKREEDAACVQSLFVQPIFFLLLPLLQEDQSRKLYGLLRIQGPLPGLASKKKNQKKRGERMRKSANKCFTLNLTS